MSPNGLNTWKRVFWFAVLLYSNNNVILISAEGNIGCLFAETLCTELVEWCYDDFVFGKCLPQYGLEPEELLRETLSEEQSGLLATMLEDLQGAGLDWEHPFVQCRMQGTLFSIRNNVPMSPNVCANLAPDPEILGPQSPLAFVRFTPPNENFADEVYYPPLKKAFDDRLFVHPPKIVEPPLHNSARIVNAPKLVTSNELNYEKNNQQLNQQQKQPKLFLPKIDIENKKNKNNIELRRILAELETGRLKANNLGRLENLSAIKNNGEEEDRSNFHHDFKRTESESYLKERQSDGYEERDNVMNILEHLTKPSNDNQPKTTSFREVSRDNHIPMESNEIPEEAIYLERGPYDSQSRTHRFRAMDESDGSLKDVKEMQNDITARESVYTEGGLVYVPEGEENKEQTKTDARNLLRDMLGFTRHERLDVKKPGPPAAPPPASPPLSLNKEVLPAHLRTEGSQKIKKLLTDHADDDHAPHSVDTEYTHVILKNPIDSWRDGARIVNAIGEMLNMQAYFSYPRVDRHEVSFRVEPNPEKKTAADIARFINDTRFKNNLSRRLGVIVIRAGVGDKTKENVSSVSSAKVPEVADGPDVTHVMAYMFAGAGAAAVVVIVITLFLIKKNDKKRDKLGGLQTGLTSAESCSKDYQELCRSRMAGKGNPTETASGRIASLSKESDVRPPSSRSSTSSWSEEPALTNMDISTGHMVLSYMEDHLRNKGRLQREWEALCRYEAEPSAREAALQAQCTPLNRPGAPLPYDHSRVVLNHLTNAEGMDYVNASTITDHDPRAPAYVAAQGPMASTLAHFWQMIWEQGAVVIVSLSRLQENGAISCARYWPEEGAEVYHIYEVHLVSEHIWCDDYLVRSFYLKNLRTSETRTVTQFHFLSWPQAGVPSSAKALLEFRRKVNKSYRGRSCPIVVHSSNGAGRTGAYILLDLVLGRMNKGAREIDIAATLEHLRDQRAGLVATRQQFEFVLMAVAEEVHAILKALPAQSTTNEKRELDKDAVKEREDESEKEKENENEKSPKPTEK